MDKLLEVRGLCAGYRRPVVQNISFSLHRGELAAVLGRNGCGKTTLLRGLTGGARVMDGTVLLDGADCTGWDPRRKARKVALLPQRARLLPGLLVGEVIAMGRYPWTGPLSGGGTEERERIRAAAAQFGVEGLLDRDCAQLSEGQCQLVQLARLAVQDAPVLLLDEPNTALDFDNTALLFDRISRLVEGGRCALMVLHDPALALARCHRLLLLDGGRLVDDITVAGRREEELQAALRRLYPTIRVRREAGGRFYCLPD